jgi:hypothetical protein
MQSVSNYRQKRKLKHKKVTVFKDYHKNCYFCPRLSPRGCFKLQAEIKPLEPDSVNTDEGNCESHTKFKQRLYYSKQ